MLDKNSIILHGASLVSYEKLRLDQNVSMRDFIGINVTSEVIGQNIEIEHGNPVTLYELKMQKVVKLMD